MTDAPIADLSALPPITEQRGGDPGLLFDELKAIIAGAIVNHPRSQQKRIGPSEIGEACDRRIAYKVAGVPEARTMPPGWRPTVGTAVHAWLEEAFAEHNMAARQDNGASRFLIEQRINAGPMAGEDLTGSTDLYDRVTATSIDWKIIGPSSHKRLKTDLNVGRGPKRAYRVQLHTYGYGFTRRGLPVDRVMLVALPAAGELDDALMWTEPFDPSVAVQAMARVDRIHALTQHLGGAAWTVTNGQLRAVGAGQYATNDGDDAPAIGTDADGCRFCPWLVSNSTDLPRACPGATEVQARLERSLASATAGLIPA